ncbi:MAG: protein TolQ [Novosphingobium sp.]
MSTLALLATAPTRLDPVQLFFDADIVVQSVMAGLVVASVWVWAIIISFSLRMAGIRKRTEAYERDFWKAADIDAFQAERGAKEAGEIPSARVVAAGLGEWRRSTAAKVIDREGTRQRLAGVMDSAVAQEADRLAERLNFLATVGSVAPFVGLFGTVWGIMNSFFQIGSQQNSSLAVVAPGISEALFATAIGLFAAIPAVIAYNRFSHRVNQLEARMQRGADRFHASLSRELDAA